MAHLSLVGVVGFMRCYEMVDASRDNTARTTLAALDWLAAAEAGSPSLRNCEKWRRWVATCGDELANHPGTSADGDKWRQFWYDLSQPLRHGKGAVVGQTPAKYVAMHVW